MKCDPQNKVVALPSARAGRASPEPASGLGHSATIANADVRNVAREAGWPDEMVAGLAAAAERQLSEAKPDPVSRAIDDLFAHETPAVRWLRQASKQLREAGL